MQNTIAARATGQVDLELFKEDEQQQQIERDKAVARQHLQQQIDEVAEKVEAEQLEGRKLRQKLDLCVGGLRNFGREFSAGAQLQEQIGKSLLAQARILTEDNANLP